MALANALNIKINDSRDLRAPVSWVSRIKVYPRSSSGGTTSIIRSIALSTINITNDHSISFFSPLGAVRVPCCQGQQSPQHLLTSVDGYLDKVLLSLIRRPQPFFFDIKGN